MGVCTGDSYVWNFTGTQSSQHSNTICHTDEPQQGWRICLWVFHLFVGWPGKWSLVSEQLLPMQQAAQHCFSSAVWFGIIYSSLAQHLSLYHVMNTLVSPSIHIPLPCMHEYQEIHIYTQPKVCNVSTDCTSPMRYSWCWLLLQQMHNYNAFAIWGMKIKSIFISSDF